MSGTWGRFAPRGPRRLRTRLIVALGAVFVAALLVSTLLDGADSAAPAEEPYQDGLVLAVFSVPALALIWLVSSWSLGPLQRASAEARKAGPADPQRRIPQDGLPAEIAPLVEAANGALDRMAEAMEAERRFTENAAHELRTPLAVLKLRLQRAREAKAETPDWTAIEEDLARMQRLVSQLLDLARKEHAGRGAAETASTNLSRAAREAAAMVLPLAEAAGRKLLADLPEVLMVSGSGDDLRDALRNLLENALLHGAGTITIAAERDAAEAAVVVSDAGEGIPEAVRGRMFERFGKGHNTHGSGLGLAIVREVARAHGGTVTLLPGPGCRIRFAVPLPSPATGG